MCNIVYLVTYAMAILLHISTKVDTSEACSNLSITSGYWDLFEYRAVTVKTVLRCEESTEWYQGSECPLWDVFARDSYQ
jgi:hypothetical protein